MKIILKLFKQISITLMFVLFVMASGAQVKHWAADQVKRPPASKLKRFMHLAAQANIEFVMPPEFKEIKVPGKENFPFDYGIELPGKEFEIWLQVKTQKENMADYARNPNNQGIPLASADSLYSTMGEASALTLTGDKKYFTRTIPPEVLARYNADEGKTYLLTLLDMPEMKHYKYALLITLQKNHTGTILAVCFTNEKGPEFFKNLSKAQNCIKFKP